MGEIIIPQGYKSALNLHDTQVAIKTVKDYFQHELTHRLHLLRVTAPLFVQPETGLNDNLNGVEHPHRGSRRRLQQSPLHLPGIFPQND